MGWSAWIPMGNPAGGFAGRPATICRNPGVTNIYARGADNRLWQRAYWDSVWQAWGVHNDGGVLASAPSLGSMGPDHEHLFVRGTDGNVYQKWWTGSTGWSGWFGLGAPPGGFFGGPVTISRNGGVCNVYVRGADNALWQLAYFDGQWHPWGRHDDGGVLADDPATSSRGAEHEQLFVRGTDAQVWHKWWVPQLPTVDINLIAVGRDHFSNADLDQMLNSLTGTRQIYAQVGLNIGNVRRFRIEASQAGVLEIIDSLAEADQLTDDWTVGNHALDVFVVRSMNGADGWSAVGGSCDKNAKGMSGSVVSLNGSLANSANTFAHEMGHYLGLDHIAAADNFIGNNGSSNSNTNIFDWQGNTMKSHCFVYFS